MTGFFRFRGARSRRARRPLAPPERFESRRVLAAEPVFATQRIEWLGRDVEVVSGRWIVKVDAAKGTEARGFASDSLAAATAGFRTALEAAGRVDWRAEAIAPRLFSLDAGDASREEVLRWARATPGVAYAEPDFMLTVDASTRMPNDTSFGSLWGLRNTGANGGRSDADIDAPEAWRLTTGSRSVVIGVLDTGIDVSHPDLAANIWKNPGEIPGNGRDDDGNGYVDDVNGWDFFSNDNNPHDDQGHGTHVAGTIGAVGNNSLGVVGVSWQVSLIALKTFGGNNQGSTSAAIAALNYVADLRRRGVNIVATNNSYGGAPYSSAFADAIEAAGAAGVLFVASAGNSAKDNDAEPRYPSSYGSDAIIAVAATTPADVLWDRSHFGARSVDVAAPGYQVYSTFPGGGYRSFNGTSMAAPHVTGTVALLAALRPDLSATKYKEAILGTVDPLPALLGKVATGGRLNAARALAYFGSAGERRVGSTTTVGFDSRNASSDVSAASAIDSLGRTVVVGTANRGIGVFAATRFLSDGRIDRSFGAGGRAIVAFPGRNATATSVAIDSRGRIVVAGHAAATTSDFAVARLTSQGVLDTSFSGDGIATFDLGRGGHDFGLAVAIGPGDAIVVAGARQHTGSDYDFGIIRLTVAGALDVAFGSSGVVTVAFDRGGSLYDVATSVAVDRQGRVVVAGHAEIEEGMSSDFAIVRLTAGGVLDTTFGSSGRQVVGFDLGSTARGRDDDANAVAIDSLGRIVVVGTVRRSNSDTDFGIVRLTSAGTLDTSFASAGRLVVAISSQFDYANAVAIDSRNRIIVAGRGFSDRSGGDDVAVIRVTAGGTLDTSFGSGGRLLIDFARGFAGRRDDTATGVRIDKKGRIIVTGHAFWGNSADADFAWTRI